MREILFLTLGAVIATFGVLASLFWTLTAGVIALLVMSLLILGVLVLQRKQLGTIQQRVLMLIRSVTNTNRENRAEAEGKGDASASFASKKLLGILQAQQTSMELLNDKIEAIQNKNI